MIIIIRSTELQKKELLEKSFDISVNVQWLKPDESFSGWTADAFFDLLFDDIEIANNECMNDVPVFVHAVNCTCKEINKPNYIRLNAWNGFLNRSLTELVCCNDAFKKRVEKIFEKLGWRLAWVADDYGFIAAGIIAMIINEAYFALEENVSTKEEIDIAMKLGTNYPYGPFAWSEKIGLRNVLNLLKKLAKQNTRYCISGLLEYESNQNLR